MCKGCGYETLDGPIHCDGYGIGGFLIETRHDKYHCSRCGHIVKRSCSHDESISDQRPARVSPRDCAL
jgi:hypothetical protein